MKKWKAWILALAFVLCLVGCKPAQYKATPSETNITTAASAPTTEPETTPPTTPPTVPPSTSGWEIVTIGLVGGEGFDLALEKFFEDEYNEYRFPCVMSEKVFVRYSNGVREKIVDALNAGRATLNDLTRFGFYYYTSPKNNE